MTQRASRFSSLSLGFILAALVPARAAAPVDELPTNGEKALEEEHSKADQDWSNLLSGATPADPANPQHQAAVDAAAKWATYRLTWSNINDPGKVSDLFRQYNDDLLELRLGREKTQKAAEMYAKQVIAHAAEVLQTRKLIARINAARMLDRLAEKASDEAITDVTARLGGGDQGDLADALAAAIKDPAQLDAARLYLFRALRALLALPRSEPPALPRDKEEAAVGAVIKFLQDHNKPFPPGTPQDEIDGFRYVRREAIKALAQCRYPTLADKTHPTLVLLKLAARDGVEPDLRMDERVEAALGVARAQADLDKDYQPDYAAHQLGLFVVDFANRLSQEKQDSPDKPPSEAWKYDASRLIEALETMSAQTKNAHVAQVAGNCTPLLGKIEKALPPPNPFDLEKFLQDAESPGKSLYKSEPQSVVQPADRTEDAKPPKPEEKKPEVKKDK
jgi:hypothetical protein